MPVENAVGNCQVDDFPFVMAKPLLLGPSSNLDDLKHCYLISWDVNKARQLPKAFDGRLLEVIILSESPDQDDKDQSHRNKDSF
jgi:hypothetical protein